MSEETKLTCTQVVKEWIGATPQGKPIYEHKKCGLPAEEVLIGGTLTKAKAVLCSKHRLQADRQAFTSQNGYPLGRIAKKEKEKGYKQARLEGTGLLP